MYKILKSLLPPKLVSKLSLLIPFSLVFVSTATAYASVHLEMGNPSGATSSTSNSTNYLMIKSQYALSYNNARHGANWVSWQLNRSWLGSAPRQNDFRPDSTLPSSWYRVSSSDYTGSGYDRGHMTPSADRTNTITNNSATFLMTNILPQAPDNNQGYWANLENYARSLVLNQEKELYIIAGGYGQQGTIASGNVAIPSRLFKIIVVTTPGTGATGVTSSTRVITIDTPNSNGNRDANWGSYRTTVDAQG